MKLSLVRGGGFAGLVIAKTVTSDSLSPEDAETLREKVEEAGLSHGPTNLGGDREKYPDSYGYAITIEDEGRGHTVVFSEENLTEPVRSLISWVDSLQGVTETIGPPT